MFQNIGDLLNYIIIAVAGIGLLVTYSKKKKQGLLWSGLGLLATGLILGVISLSKVNESQSQEIIIKQDSTPINPDEALSEYKGVIEYLLKKADTTKADTVIDFFDFKINLPSDVVYDNNSEEPMLLIADSTNDLIVTFKEEDKKEIENLEKYSKSVVETLEGNQFSSGYQFSNKKVTIKNRAIQYDYSKTHKGIEIINGQIFFVVNNGRLFRVSISKMGVSEQSLSTEKTNLKEKIKENVLQQGV